MDKKKPKNVKIDKEYMDLAYPEDSRPPIEIETELLSANIERLEKLLPKLRIKLSSVISKEDLSFDVSTYTEDKSDSVVTAILREKNVRLSNFMNELETIIDSLEL